MFRIVKKSALNQLRERESSLAERLNTAMESENDLRGKLKISYNEVENLRAELIKIQEQAEEAFRDRDALSEKVSELENRVSQSALDPNKNTVTIQISDDFQTITPVVKYKKESAESMVHLGMISDSEYESEFPVQIALMNIAHEGLSQILEAFEASDNDFE